MDGLEAELESSIIPHFQARGLVIVVREKLESKYTWGEGLTGLWRQIPVSVLLV